MTDNSLQGTGDTLVSLELPDGHGTFSIKDDGDPDDYIEARIETDSGNSTFRQFRADVGDETFVDLFERALTGESTASVGADAFETTPPVFKCDDCNQSYPRSQNQTPGSTADTCPNCADGGGGQ